MISLIMTPHRADYDDEVTVEKILQSEVEREVEEVRKALESAFTRNVEELIAQAQKETA